MENGDSRRSRHEAELIELVRREMPRFRQIVERRIAHEFRSLIAPDDVIQDACAAAFQSLDSFHRHGSDSMERWFTIILLRSLTAKISRASALKRGGRNPARPTADQLESSIAGLAAIVMSPMKTPSRIAASSEAQAALHAALAMLPTSSRRAIWMHYIEGTSRAELARVMNKSVPAVNSILYRGLRALKLRMGDGSSFFSDCSPEAKKDQPTPNPAERAKM